jgi:hypothetical protein
MNVKALLLLLPILAGCVSVKKIYDSRGRQRYLIKCNGTADSWAKCYEKAGDICGSRGYRVLEKTEERGVATLPTSNGIFVAINARTAFQVLTVSCK